MTQVRPRQIRHLDVFLKTCQDRIAEQGSSARTLLAIEGPLPQRGRRYIAPGLSGFFTGEYSPEGRPVYAVRAVDCLRVAEAGGLVERLSTSHRKKKVGPSMA
ncbi:hypothetical protein [Deinococcus aluminii]